MKAMLGFGFVLVGASILVAAAGCGASDDDAELGEARQAACAHGVCGAGGALAASCDPCAQQICAVDPYCCASYWDSICVGEVSSVCKLSCSGGSTSSSSSSSTSSTSSSTSSTSSSTSSTSSGGSGGAACAHATCTAGVKLSSTCDPCAQKICAVDSYCCNTAWDSICVGEVASICKQSCSGGSSSSSSSTSSSSSSGSLACSHDKCTIGYTLDKSSCDPCVTSICTVDPYCCLSDWDNLCVSEVKSICGITYCPAVNLSVCSHDKCATGGRLFPACDPCVKTVCAADPYCCSEAWNATCVAEAKSMCGAACP